MVHVDSLMWLVAMPCVLGSAGVAIPDHILLHDDEDVAHADALMAHDDALGDDARVCNRINVRPYIQALLKSEEARVLFESACLYFAQDHFDRRGNVRH